MSTLRRWIPWLTIGLGLIHCGYALFEPASAWRDIAEDGFVGAAADSRSPEFLHREYSLYSFACGFLILSLGTLARLMLRLTGRIPAQIGWYLVAVGALLCVVEFPATGGWAVLLLGVLTLVSSGRPLSSGPRPSTRQPHAASGTPGPSTGGR